jgi:hypothetical protein
MPRSRTTILIHIRIMVILITTALVLTSTGAVDMADITAITIIITATASTLTEDIKVA